MLNAASTAHAGERRNCRGQLHGQGNRPLARIVTCSRGTLAHEKLNVIEGSFTVECLTKVHPSLAQHTDGPVADQVTNKPCKRQGARAFVLIVEAESHLARDQFIAGLISPRLIQRRFEPHHHAIAAPDQLPGRHPPAIGAQDFVVVRAHQAAAVLQYYRNAITLALHHHLGLSGHREATV
ncbi:MAG TPA: hypothetical protein VNY25_02165, partial [Steroidobacteraceae bacterium]|nr:hypothetical protein [Steroidobacteraceae bacterium]